MQHMKARSTQLFIVALVALVGIVVAVTAGASVRSPGPPPIEFAAVSSETLAGAGITLVQTAANPPIPQVAAERAATTALGGAAAREAYFARCDVSDSVPQVHRDCWAVSLDPSGFRSHGPRGATTMAATYLVALIDAQSSKLILAEAGR